MLLGAGEIVVVLAVALMVLGPKKMPEVARTIARFLGQLRRISEEVRAQVDDALNESPKPASLPPEVQGGQGPGAKDGPESLTPSAPGAGEDPGPSPASPSAHDAGL